MESNSANRSIEIKDNWHEEFFPGGWDFVQDDFMPSERTALEVAFIDSFAKENNLKKILDVPCGTGRVSIELAKMGYPVTGIDFNPNVVKKARERSAGLDVEFIEGDMRSLPYKEEFDLITCMWGSFGYFSDEENFAFIESAAKALKPGGAVIMDAILTECIMRFFRPSDVRRVSGGFLIEEREFDFETSRINVEWTFLSDENKFIRTSSIRLYTYMELISLLKKAGFTKFLPYGGYNREDFSINNLRLNLCAFK